MKIQHIEENDFSYHEIEIDDEFYNLSQSICDAFENTGSPNFIKGAGPGLVLRSDKKTLCFCVDLAKTRMDREIGTNLYRVCIQKVRTKEEIRNSKIDLLAFEEKNSKKKPNEL